MGTVVKSMLIFLLLSSLGYTRETHSGSGSTGCQGSRSYNERKEKIDELLREKRSGREAGESKGKSK